MKVGDIVVGKERSDFSWLARIRRDIEPGRYFEIRGVGNREANELRLATLRERIHYHCQQFLCSFMRLV